jgi:glycerol-3-phosphate dehydrogenase (NAD(P)+)
MRSLSASARPASPGRWRSHVRGSVFPAAVAGPCIAGELARRVPTCVVLTGRDSDALDNVADLISTPYYRVFPSVDLKGTELSAALKNAFAMGIALAAGMHEKKGGAGGSVAMHNLESAIFAEAVRELRTLIIVLGGDPDTAFGLAGVGDIDVTTNGGRTGKFGRLLGTGMGLAAAKRAMDGATLECLEILQVMRLALDALEKEGAARKSRFPLLVHLMAVALDDAPPEVPLDRFFAS